MKFFTRNFIHGNHPDRDGAIAGYQKHLEALKLPSEIADLAALWVHDAQIRTVSLKGNKLTIRLCCGNLQRGYSHARLNFTGARITDHARNLLRHPQTEILASEVDRSAGAYQYRLLRPQGHITLCFRTVEIHRRPLPRRTRSRTPK